MGEFIHEASFPNGNAQISAEKLMHITLNKVNVEQNNDSFLVSSFLIDRRTVSRLLTSSIGRSKANNFQ